MNRREFIKSVGMAIGSASVGIPILPKLHSGGIVNPKFVQLAGTFVQKHFEGVVWCSLENPVAILRDLLLRVMPKEKIDLESFDREIEKCEELVDPMVVPEQTVMDSISYLASKSKTCVCLRSAKDKSNWVTIMPEEEAKERFPDDLYRKAEPNA